MTRAACRFGGGPTDAKAEARSARSRDPERALELAREAAGGKDVSLAGGADLVQQFIRNGWLGELLLHVVPVLACGGRRLFDNLDDLDDLGGSSGSGHRHIEWQKTQVLDSPGATHIRLRAPHTVAAE
ncbi:dihydrofolate reductase family protein [Streptomyces sp. 3214.6]|uniref:dihydrofolate reductase family protein n=1 Tax=Streptomyces sp. 3214.6 TaxID=1882757 RepID=UPI001E52AEB4|nr:dihydrofolate reductase family protein [Streptomyces sp. 3214.6]